MDIPRFIIPLIIIPILNVFYSIKIIPFFLFQQFCLTWMYYVPLFFWDLIYFFDFLNYFFYFLFISKIFIDLIIASDINFFLYYDILFYYLYMLFNISYNFFKLNYLSFIIFFNNISFLIIEIFFNSYLIFLCKIIFGFILDLFYIDFIELLDLYFYEWVLYDMSLRYFNEVNLIFNSFIGFFFWDYNWYYNETYSIFVPFSRPKMNYAMYYYVEIIKWAISLRDFEPFQRMVHISDRISYYLECLSFFFWNSIFDFLSSYGRVPMFRLKEDAHRTINYMNDPGFEL